MNSHQTSSNNSTSSSLAILFQFSIKLPVIHTFFQLNIEFPTTIFSL
ncbi:hypothetical protein HOF65_07870 [bacterium]|nr:hypothetical protein [bacterium]MBT3853808.1 hypothetical protein [bacterium]MBT4633636.1 hypothetical protein [bacterium]MBT6779376.1 hypothetical protein [bacterium]